MGVTAIAAAATTIENPEIVEKSFFS